MHHSRLATTTSSGTTILNGLSRLPLKTKERAEKVVDAVNVFNMKQLEPLPDRLKTSEEKPKGPLSWVKSMRWWVKDG
mgnify:CR=1 FL=1